MPRPITLLLLMALIPLAGCGGGGDKEDEHDRPPQRQVMKPEETVFRDLVTAPGKVEARTNEAMATHREALEQRLREDEGDGQK